MSDIPTNLDTSDPEEMLAAVLALRRYADKLEIKAVQKAIAEGWSWADVAGALEVSKQAAHKRLSPHVHNKRGSDV